MQRIWDSVEFGLFSAALRCWVWISSSVVSNKHSGGLLNSFFCSSIIVTTSNTSSTNIAKIYKHSESEMCLLNLCLVSHLQFMLSLVTRIVSTTYGTLYSHIYSHVFFKYTHDCFMFINHYYFSSELTDWPSGLANYFAARILLIIWTTNVCGVSNTL